MKKLNEIKSEKPIYFVCINGVNEFESSSLASCKKILCDTLKMLRKNGIKIMDTYNYYIGMYSITIE